MFDDFRQQVGDENAFDEEPQEAPQETPAAKMLSGLRNRRAEQRSTGRGMDADVILGMTGPQRFVLAVLLLLVVVMLGALILVLTEKVIVPI